ncbi:MAG: tetratricopeptide repeat protein, partial [Bacteroidetes bacterium]|nr:tetratricopeptide repeat protein [Bacteroidota bacterium]
VELIDFFRFEEAKILLEEALQYFPNEQNFKINMGICKTELNEYSDAMEIFNSILSKDNDCYLAYINRAILFRKLEKYSKAIKDLEKAIDIDECDSHAINEIVITYSEMGKNKTALEYAKILVETEPEEEYGYLILGFVYSAMGKNNKALKAFNHILNEMNPFDHWALLNRGKILFEEFDETEKALKDLEFAQTLGNPYASEIIEEIYSD